ncbi:MAG: GGDEF domain-containing protein [Sphaerospermopsis sp. SIO1G2]|nr:GGDEF domain-containing protein [Sphaerospermopsis sp. SIO1G2]
MVNYQVKNTVTKPKCSNISDQITLSVGIASMIPTHENSPEIIIAAADQALYQAKAQGRNTFCIYNQDK